MNYLTRMAQRSLQQKLEILADAAKYDASCASSGGKRRDSRDGKGLGSVTGAGICHSYTPDGRCISLLKILLTNFCIYDCAYCINRASSSVPRARFTVEEVVTLTMEFYRRNYIEGLFLSSGIFRSPDATMEEMIHVARVLRERENFRGYIHLKTIPESSAELIAEAGRLADRLSVNIELPTSETLKSLAPEKSESGIKRSMAVVQGLREAAKDQTPSGRRPPAFAPSGQSTQVIVGADGSNDATILRTAHNLYTGYDLKRVYYSAFSPIPDASPVLPLKSPPLLREHRLYQADWLMRFYGFELSEVAVTGMLDLDIDPKMSWALANPGQFPVDVNRADREVLLRVPGLGVRSAGRIVSARRHRELRYRDLLNIGVSMKSARHFLCLPDWRPRLDGTTEALRARLVGPEPEQLSLF
jgi:putative DNA modification/repair radical SAM protein